MVHLVAEQCLPRYVAWNRKHRGWSQACAWIGLSIGPVAFFLWNASSNGTLSTDPERSITGLLDDWIFLAYFVVFPCIPVLVEHCYSATRDALRDAANYVRLRTDPDSKIGLSEEGIAALSAHYTAVLSRGSMSVSAEHVDALHDLDLSPSRFGPVEIFALISYLLGFGFLGLSTYSHYAAIEVYEFELWCGAMYPGAFWGRFVYEFATYVGIYSTLGLCLFRIGYICWTLPRALRTCHALEFVPSPIDDAGNLGSFGRVATQMALAILIACIPLFVYIATYPPTVQMAIGGTVIAALIPTIVFVPLWRVHRALVELRRGAAKAIARPLDSLRKRLVSEANSSPGTDKENAEHFEDLQRRYDALHKIWKDILASSVWPYPRRVQGLAAAAASIIISALWSRLL